MRVQEMLSKITVTKQEQASPYAPIYTSSPSATSQIILYIYIYTPLSQPAASRPTGTRTRRRPETGSLPEILDGPATRPPRRCALEASAAAGGSWAPSAVDWAVSAGQGSANSRRRRPAPRGAGGCRIGCRAPEGRWGPTPRRDAKAAAADRGRHTGARPRRPRRFGRR